MFIHNKEKKIYIFRHGETDWNINERISGQLENAPISFTQTGIAQIIYLRKLFKIENIEVIFSSDLKRARDTANSINEVLNVPISFHKELRSLDMGIYQGMLYSDFINKSEVAEIFVDYDKCIKNGESINQLINRTKQFVHNIALNCTQNHIAIITHGAVVGNLYADISNNSFIEIDKCILNYNNGIFDLVDIGYYCSFVV